MLRAQAVQVRLCAGMWQVGTRDCGKWECGKWDCGKWDCGKWDCGKWDCGEWDWGQTAPCSAVADLEVGEGREREQQRPQRHEDAVDRVPEQHAAYLQCDSLSRL
jgi:hypothetical protein